MKEVNVKVLIPDDVDPKKVLDLSLMVRYQKENDKWQFVTMPFVLADADKAEYIKKEEVIAELNNWAYFELNVQRKPEVSEHRKNESQIVIYVCEALKNRVNRLHTYLIPDSADIEKIREEIEEQAYLGINDQYSHGLFEALRIIDKHINTEVDKPEEIKIGTAGGSYPLGKRRMLDNLLPESSYMEKIKAEIEKDLHDCMIIGVEPNDR